MLLNTEVRSIAEKFYIGAASPRALTCYLMLKYGEFGQLADLRIDPTHYDSPHRFRVDNACTELLRKYEGLPTGIDTVAAAEENFLAAEKQCYATNQRLIRLLCPTYTDESAESDRLWVFISKVRKIIATILGPCPSSFTGRFGPGATYADKGSNTTIPDKISSTPTFTPKSWPFLINWAGCAWARAQAALDVSLPASVPGNRFTTVPKDATKDRGICVEPSINGFFQLGVGRALRARLRRTGIDLRYGQEIHRQVACEGSLTGAIATIDLTNASDTVAYNLVKLLLPHDWFVVLDQLRSPRTLFRDKWYLLEKFSSMGNGFTFELETLIFLGLARACIPNTQWDSVYCYGDDIIIPVEHSREVVASLKFFGFTPNMRKTHTQGWFRESCGGDFFKGQPVRAFHLKELPNEPQHFISIANGIRALGLRDSPSNFGLSWTIDAWHRVLDCIPRAVRNCRGPASLGDIVIHDSPDRCTGRVRNCILYYRCYKPVARIIPWRAWHPEVQYSSVLYRTGSSRGVTPRRGVSGFKIGWVACS